MQTESLSRGIGYIIFLVIAAGYTFGHETYCAYSKMSVVKVSVTEKSSTDEELEPIKTGELLDGNHTERCPNTKSCYALWQEDNVNKTVIIAQGCWAAAEFDCSEGVCIASAKKPQKKYNNTTTKFCCCYGDMCNVNVSESFLPSEENEATPRYVEHASYDTQTVIIAVATMCSLAVIIMLAACFAYHMCSSSPKPSPDSVCLMEPPLPPSPTFNLDSLKIAESIGRGRYGHVFRGTLYNQSVAVKIFSSQNRQNYINERYIYCLPFMDHLCLPKLLGAEERTGVDEKPEYLLVLSYAPNGCLQDYLTNNTIDWPWFCRMAQSITQGLAHLHMEIRKEGKVKMCIAHRDLTSRNILIKADGSCMLCDFGFAICISGSKYYINGEEQVAESTSLMDVGTLRYMAPEVLEGAVNLRDCESSLKQIDVYALGLILWELATRCTDLFQGVEVPDYKAPFVAEIGNHPTMEQMQVLVAKHKARPLFPDIWKDTNPAVRALKETIEDCWDQDAEARLTALCVEERLIELPVLWDRYKSGTAIQGVSPTVNPMSASQTRTSNGTIQSSGNGWFRGSTFEMPVMKSNAEGVSPTNWGLDNRYSGDFSMSENTAETTITMSPCELTPRSCPSNSSSNGYNLKNLTANNVVTSNLRVTVPLQPYQGKNPIMERNLIIEPVEDVTISGNTLIERGDKFSSRNNSANSFNLDADLFNTLQTNEQSESNALVQNDVLSHSTRAVNPIPYVQNAVHIVSTMPKQPNIPGNGHSLQMGNGAVKSGKKEERGIITGFKNFFKFPKSTSVAEPNPTIPKHIEGSTVPKAVEPPTVNVPKLHNKVPKPLGVTNLTKTQSMDTEVYIMDPNDEFSMTQTVVRPVANRQVYSQTVPEETNVKHFEGDSSKKFPFQNGFVQSQTHPQLCSDNNPKMKRPNTLPIAKLESCKTTANNLAPNPLKIISAGSESSVNQLGHQVNAERENRGDNSDGAKSNQSKNARFSLYDDRIMTSNTRLYQQIEHPPCKLGSPHISASVPLSIDSLCESEVTSFHKTFQSQPRTNDNQ
ncbi:probable serine/threonine-protein kinase DDB_G0278665 isoform X2 [Stegodyphus dumicola]|uniref:probable serine/threonine-protein kinase DDB_G0278665 isoform X2 n=1 Tax=Stegodyphus dumicola TaxID=202533 RepID=UPI0015B1AE57|nr:probable serine/threonine-protein kinase DDB_G0278665 isoform X2 [Stegodyphus dumicola]